MIISTWRVNSFTPNFTMSVKTGQPKSLPKIRKCSIKMVNQNYFIELRKVSTNFLIFSTISKSRSHHSWPNFICAFGRLSGRTDWMFSPFGPATSEIWKSLITSTGNRKFAFSPRLQENGRVIIDQILHAYSIAFDEELIKFSALLVQPFLKKCIHDLHEQAVDIFIICYSMKVGRQFVTKFQPRIESYLKNAITNFGRFDPGISWKIHSLMMSAKNRKFVFSWKQVYCSSPNFTRVLSMSQERTDQAIFSPFSSITTRNLHSSVAWTQSQRSINFCPTFSQRTVFSNRMLNLSKKTVTI